MLQNGGRVLGLNWVEYLSRAFYMVVLARYLGAELYGHWAYGVAVYAMLIGLTGAGFDTLMSIRIGAEKANAGRILGIALGLRLAGFTAAVVLLVGYALAWETDPLSRVVLLALVPALVGRGVAFWARACFVAFERTREYLYRAAGFRLGEVALGTAWILSGGGLAGVVAIHSLMWMAEGAVGLVAVHNRLGRLRPVLRGPGVRAFFQQGAVLSLAAAAQAWLQAGPVVLTRYVIGDMTALGQVALVLNVMTMVVASLGSFAGATVPVLSRLYDRGDPRLRHYGLLSLLAIATAALAAAGLGWFAGPPVAAWLLGPQYADAGRMVGPAMLVAGLVLAPTGYVQLLILAGRRWVQVVAGITGSLALIVAVPVAVATVGDMGAVLAAGIGWGVRAAVLIGWGMVALPSRKTVE